MVREYKFMEGEAMILKYQLENHWIIEVGNSYSVRWDHPSYPLGKGDYLMKGSVFKIVSIELKTNDELTNVMIGGLVRLFPDHVEYYFKIDEFNFCKHVERL